jgi:hypothetical protein
MVKKNRGCIIPRFFLQKKTAAHLGAPRPVKQTLTQIPGTPRLAAMPATIIKFLWVSFLIELPGTLSFLFPCGIHTTRAGFCQPNFFRNEKK